MNKMNNFRTWFRNLTDVSRQCEINRLVTRAARRCTRDFRHAIEHIDFNDPCKKRYQERVRFWQETFWDGGIYRDEIHHVIGQLERDVARLEKQLRAAGIEPETELPF